jgi:N utilization substance protein B
MARRSRAREVALQLLYESDRNAAGPEGRDRQFIESRLRGSALRQFAQSLVDGVRTHEQRIDQIIEQVAQNWTLTRMTPVDRSILRIATFEVLFGPDTPPKVAIDEAIELAKRFGTAESGRFVNGILDRVVTNFPRAATAEPAGDAAPSDLAPPSESLHASIP